MLCFTFYNWIETIDFIVTMIAQKGYWFLPIISAVRYPATFGHYVIKWTFFYFYPNFSELLLNLPKLTKASKPGPD